jgi:hypothetical protein
MTHYPQPHATHRATRIQLQTIPALIKLSDGQKTKAKLQVVSINGGLLQVAKALAEGDFVELAFQTQSGNVHGMAELLGALKSASGSIYQPFRFVALGDEDHQVLKRLVETAGDRSFLGLRSSQFASSNF